MAHLTVVVCVLNLTCSLLFLRERVSDSSSDSDSDSDSDSGDDPKSTKAQDRIPDMDEDDDEESGGPTSNAVVRTKNELANDDINIPKISEVGPDEPLAKVGEVMSVVNNVVIIKGTASSNQLRANEKALDSDTLLVFDDRKVMGYVSGSIFLCLFCSYISSRFMRLLDRRISHSTKSSITKVTLSTRRG